MTDKKYICVKKYYRWRQGAWMPCHESEFFKAFSIADSVKHYHYNAPCERDITFVEFGGNDLFYSSAHFEVRNA